MSTKLLALDSLDEDKHKKISTSSRFWEHVLWNLESRYVAARDDEGH